MTDNDHPETVESSYRPVIRQAATVVVMLSLFAVQPVAAQSNAVCSADNLPSMIEGFFQLTTTLGIVGLAIVWQADSPHRDVYDHSGSEGGSSATSARR